jgi:soluble lytic murein transglycosylase-like protein
VWRVVKFLFRLFGKLAFWQQLVVVVCLPLVLLNTTVAFVGRSAIFPLSPFYLRQKLTALELYAKHRPWCLLTGHDDVVALAEAAEKKHGLPTGLMRAIVAVESGNHAHRISYAGAMGPAQLMPATAALLDVDDPFDPAQAIDAGARYLAQQLKRSGRIDLAVAAYNAGPGAVNRVVPRNGETEFYVAKVLKELRAAGRRSAPSL